MVLVAPKITEGMKAKKRGSNVPCHKLYSEAIAQILVPHKKNRKATLQSERHRAGQLKYMGLDPGKNKTWWMGDIIRVSPRVR